MEVILEIYESKLKLPGKCNVELRYHISRMFVVSVNFVQWTLNEQLSDVGRGTLHRISFIFRYSSFDILLVCVCVCVQKNAFYYHSVLNPVKMV